MCWGLLRYGPEFRLSHWSSLVHGMKSGIPRRTLQTFYIETYYIRRLAGVGAPCRDPCAIRMCFGFLGKGSGFGNEYWELPNDFKAMGWQFLADRIYTR